MLNKPAIKIGFAVVALAAAAALFYNHFTSGGDPNEDRGQTTFWLCQNDACGAEFDLTLDEAAEIPVVDGAIPCAACGRVLATRAFQCPACKRAIRPAGHASMPTECEHCGANPDQLTRELKQRG